MRAAANVYAHEIRVEACYEAASRTLATGRFVGYWLRGTDQLFIAAKTLDRHRVRVEGTTIDVRNSRWREWGRPNITALKISGVADECTPPS